jgi:hypothetical protein
VSVLVAAFTDRAADAAHDEAAPGRTTVEINMMRGCTFAVPSGGPMWRIDETAVQPRRWKQPDRSRRRFPSIATIAVNGAA